MEVIMHLISPTQSLVKFTKPACATVSYTMQSIECFIPFLTVRLFLIHIHAESEKELIRQSIVSAPSATK